MTHIPSSPQPTILYVEDDRRLAEVVGEFFARLLPWAEIVHHASISEAMEFVASGNVPVAVISDGYLNGYNGNETAVKLQAELDRHVPYQVPFAVLTGNIHDFPPEKFGRTPLVVAEKGGTTGPQEIARRLQACLRPNIQPVA